MVFLLACCLTLFIGLLTLIHVNSDGRSFKTGGVHIMVILLLGQICFMMALNQYRAEQLAEEMTKLL